MDNYQSILRLKELCYGDIFTIYKGVVLRPRDAIYPAKKTHIGTGIFLWESMKLCMCFISGQHRICCKDKNIEITSLPLAVNLLQMLKRMMSSLFPIPIWNFCLTVVISRKTKKAKSLLACITSLTLICWILILITILKRGFFEKWKSFLM